MSDRRTAAAVDRWALAHRDELVRDLVELIRIPSVARYDESSSPMGQDCLNALLAFQSLARRYGLQTENHEDHCLSVLLPGKETRCELGILGHLDVVPQGGGWTYPAFEGILKNGYVIGRGSVDNKGPLLMALYALRCMQALGIQLHSGVRLLAGCDEERNMRDIRHYLAHHQPPAFTLNCDGTWGVGIGEKGHLTADLVLPIQGDSLAEISGGEAGNMVPAFAWARLKDAEEPICATGQAAHCAVPQAGTNAIRLLLNALQLTGKDAAAIATLAKIMQDDDGTALGIRYADSLSRTTCVGSLLTMQDGALHLHIDVRFAITQPSNQLVKRLNESCAKLGLTVQNLCVHEPRYTDSKQPEIELLMDTCREFVSKRHRPYVSGGGTHSRLFPRSVPFGVIATDRPRRNALGGPHAANEAVCVDELLQAIKVYVVALIRLDSFFKEKGDFMPDGE